MTVGTFFNVRVVGVSQQKKLKDRHNKNEDQRPRVAQHMQDFLLDHGSKSSHGLAPE
jgi:hypothetical protein